MLDLIQEVGWDNVTIGALAERADVGRSTFYSHYRSKEDLLFDGFDAWMESVGAPSAVDTADTDAARPENGDLDVDHFRFSMPLLRHIASRRRFFMATMVRSRSSRIRRRVLGTLVSRVRSELRRMERDATDATAHAVAGAFLEVVTWWLEHGTGTSIEEVDHAFQRAVGQARFMPGPRHP